MKKMKNRNDNPYPSILIFIFLCLAGNPAYASGERKVEGIYIVSGGESYLVIESGFWGSPLVKEGEIQTCEGFGLPLKTLSHSLDRKGGALHLFQQEIYEYGKNSYSYYKVISNFTLKPSLDIPGDWDLVDGEIRGLEIERNKMLTKEFFKDLYLSYSLEDLKDNFVSYLPKRRTDLMFHYKWNVARGNLPSFLHRVDDPHVKEYYQLRQNGIIDDRTLQLAQALARSHPNDPYVTLHMVEMEALKGDTLEALNLWEKWKKSHGAYPDSLLLPLAESVFHTVCIQVNKKNRPDWQSPGDFFTVDYPKGRHNLKETLEFYKYYFDTDIIFFTSKDLVPPLKVPGYHGPKIPNFLEAQVSSKVIRTIAAFSLFQGKRREGLELLASVYRMGQSMNAHGVLIQRLIGIAVRYIASGGLKIFVLNACETKDDFQECWNILERLHNTPFQEDGTRLWWGEYPPLTSLMEDCPGSRSHWRTPDAESEAKSRHRRSNMEFDLVRLAAAAKYRLLLSGDFPSSESDFSPFFPKGLPKDEFTTGSRLRFMPLSKNELVIYSVGPDNHDDKALLEYDPTNGTVSKGDISIRIPRERDFPFPRKAVHASSAFELLKQFPNGLPADVFADTKGLPFSIIESTDAQPVVIFSFGPDTDQHEISIIPEPDSSFLPVPTPDPGQNPSPGRLLQKVFRRAEKIPLSPGSWLPDTLYDPTNGTVTNGDLFIEIPR